MFTQDRDTLIKLISNVEITGDLFFAFEQGFICPNELNQVLSNHNYKKAIFDVYYYWYKNIACEEQKLLCDLSGYLSLNDQFNDLQLIISVSIEDALYSPNNIQNYNEFDKLFLEDFPIRNEDDLNNNTNIVYILNNTNRKEWRDSVQSILFNINNYQYQGVSVKESMEWFKSYFKEKKLKDMLILISENEEYILDDYPTEIIENKTDKIERSLISKILNIKKSKEFEYSKKSIKRALKLLTSFISDEDFRRFMKSSGFIIESDLFNYSFKKSNTSLLSHTLNPISFHIPYCLTLLNKNNVELCNICIYFNETPVLDQIIATILHLKSGNEDYILNTGNFYNKKEDYYKEPYFNNSYIKKSSLPTNQNETFLKIQNSVFKALPNFIGTELPEFLYRDFCNITFDSFFDLHSRNEFVNYDFLPENINI